METTTTSPPSSDPSKTQPTQHSHPTMALSLPSPSPNSYPQQKTKSKPKSAVLDATLLRTHLARAHLLDLDLALSRAKSVQSALRTRLEEFNSSRSISCSRTLDSQEDVPLLLEADRAERQVEERDEAESKGEEQTTASEVTAEKEAQRDSKDSFNARGTALYQQTLRLAETLVRRAAKERDEAGAKYVLMAKRALSVAVAAKAARRNKVQVEGDRLEWDGDVRVEEKGEGSMEHSIPSQ